jgi:sugar phosphate isomerase/epimerase
MKLHDGVRGIDILLENTDPQLVKMELDVAWVTFGGANPIDIIVKNPERYPLLHMKDFAHLHPGSQEAKGVRDEAVFSEVGTGVVDTAGVVEVAKRVGVEWLVIEQDRMNTLEPKESLETSARNLRALV